MEASDRDTGTLERLYTVKLRKIASTSIFKHHRSSKHTRTSRIDRGSRSTDSGVVLSWS